jgi:uncharacterized protein (TIGR01777 family)
MPKKVLITGGTGLIGRALAARLQEAGFDVGILTRGESNEGRLNGRSVRFVHWNAKDAEGWLGEADGAYAIVNLAGRSIASGRWSAPVKKRILESRLLVGRAVCEAVRRSGRRPRVVVQASAIGYYGDGGEDTIDESRVRGMGFLADVSRLWEQSTEEVESLGVRRVVVRTALVLASKADFVRRVSLPFRFFVGGPQGRGKQWVSWIHVEDEARAIAFLLDRDDLCGAFNLASPNPLRNRDLARKIGNVMRRPAWIAVPAFLLRAALGEMAEELLLTSQRVVPKRLLESGFSFLYPDVGPALEDVFSG